MDAVSKAKGEVSLSVKLIRQNGTEEQYSGEEIKQVELPQQLVNEYKELTKRIKEIEAEFLTIMVKNQGE